MKIAGMTQQLTGRVVYEDSWNANSTSPAATWKALGTIRRGHIHKR